MKLKIEIEKIKTGEAVNFDTVVCAAFEDGFKHAYMKIMHGGRLDCHKKRVKN